MKKNLIINFLGIILLIFLKILDIELTLFCLRTGKVMEINPIGIFILSQDLIMIYILSLSPFILLSFCFYFCYINNEVKWFKRGSYVILYLIFFNLIIIINNFYVYMTVIK